MMQHIQANKYGRDRIIDFPEMIDPEMVQNERNVRSRYCP